LPGSSSAKLIWAHRIGLSYHPAGGVYTADFAHALILSPKSAVAVVAAVYPKNIRRLAILLFLIFQAIVDDGR
jgi:hypothetical protein